MEIKFISDNDIDECNNFHNRAYKSRRTLAQWHWQFDQMLGNRRPFVIARDNGCIVGTQALMPIIMIDAFGNILTAKSEETLVDLNMRGKRLFQKMYEPLMSYAITQDVKAVWGFTPANKIFEDIGFFVPDRTSQLFCPLSHQAAAAFDNSADNGLNRIARKAIVGIASVVSSARFAIIPIKKHRYKLKILNDSPEEAGAFCKEFVRTWGGVTILRDQAYLKWRYFDNPVVRATLLGAYDGDKLVGWLTYSLDNNSMGYIVDSMVINNRDAKIILTTLMLQGLLALRAAGAFGIRTWHLNSHPFDRLILEVARSLGFYLVRRGEPIVVYLTEDGYRRSSLACWDNWYMTRAYTQGEAG